jgi:hypothetical protein
MRRASLLMLALVPAVALSATPKRTKLMTIREVSAAKVQLVPGGRASVQVRGTGLAKVKTLAVVQRTKAGAYVTSKRLGARITSKTDTLLTIELGAARAATFVTGALALGVTGVNGMFTLPETTLGVAVIPATGPSGAAGPGTGLLGTGSASSSGAATRPGLDLGGATPSLTGPSTRAPMTSSQKNPSSMAGNVWGGTTQSEERESSDGTRSSETVEFYTNENGDRMTVTTTEQGGHVYQSVHQETSDGKVTESNSVDGEEQGTDEGGETAEGGDTGGTDTGGTEGGDDAPTGDDGTDTVATPVEPGSSGSHQNPFKPALDRSSPGAAGGNIDPNPEGTGGARSSGGTTPTVGEAAQALGKKGLGGDPVEATSSTGALNPAKVAPAAPDKGNVDPVPSAARSPAATLRKAPGATGTPDGRSGGGEPTSPKP